MGVILAFKHKNYCQLLEWHPAGTTPCTRKKSLIHARTSKPPNDGAYESKLHIWCNANQPWGAYDSKCVFLPFFISDVMQINLKCILVEAGHIWQLFKHNKCNFSCIQTRYLLNVTNTHIHSFCFIGLLAQVGPGHLKQPVQVFDIPDAYHVTEPTVSKPWRKLKT